MSAVAPARAATRPRTGARVLLVEDEPGLLRALLINLRARQYDVVTASSGREALATAAQRPPDAVILDLGLPDIDGTEVIVELRRWSRAPIIVLSGRASPGDKIGALDVGADDYVTKPFSMAELLARRPGQLVSARQLLTEIWGPGYEPRTNYLRFHMARLRRKLEDDPARPRQLLTEPGMGYRYRP